MPRDIRLAWFPHYASSWETNAHYLRIAATFADCFNDDNFGRAIVRARPSTRMRGTIDAYFARYAHARASDQPWRTAARMTTRMFTLLGWATDCPDGGHRLTEEGMTVARLDVPSDAARDAWISALMNLRMEPGDRA